MSATPDSASATADREIVLSRTFAAPRELVFSVWTDQRHVGAWWGPRGFTTTTHAMDVRPGGTWTYVMHGPDGTDYDNWIRYRTVERPALLVYDHGGAADEPAHFTTTITFAEIADGTEVTMRSVFPTAAARDAVVQRYGAIEGGKQHLARLGEHLSGLARDAREPGRDRGRQRFSRQFAAPREAVFSAWTDPAQLARWWGPHEFTNPVCIFEPRVGGRIHIDMQGPDGVVHPMRGEVREFVPPERLVFIAFPLDERDEPLFEVVNTVHFTAKDGGTLVVVDTDVRGVTPAARIPLDGMEAGWTQALERLDDLLTDPHGGDPAYDIVTTRLFRHPPERVFAAWTDPVRLARWWGPKGFTSTFQEFSPHPGGDWRFVMHAPGGGDFVNHCVFREISPPRRLLIDHIGEMHAFGIRAGFYPIGDDTLVRFRMRFADAAECAKVRTFAEPCNEQMFDRLEAVLAEG